MAQDVQKDTDNLFASSVHGQDHREVFDNIEANLGCCGSNGTIDYTIFFFPIPDSCRDGDADTYFTQGCFRPMFELYILYMHVWFSFGIVICSCQVAQMALSLITYCQLRSALGNFHNHLAS
ncbi:PREDICTED: uncharacterized protein LOC106809750 [Priapulus caudatus]|uniref:Uncharacterized protein LOC106809750 n=1 Tax=Priapulus caudatus TaxID=37621 RepID=A0ABM1E8A7_PRICU|nr:PREDICTED: uncharacterized protein LOC106809750 [Priapulus caudatus]